MTVPRDEEQGQSQTSSQWVVAKKTFDAWVSGEQSSQSSLEQRSCWWLAAVPGLTRTTESTPGLSRSHCSTFNF